MSLLSKKTRFVAIILMVLTLFFIVSCVSTEDEVFDREFNFEQEAVDLNGVTINYWTSCSAETILGLNFNTLFGDLVTARISEIEKQYNFKLAPRYFDAGDQSIYNIVMAGSTACDITQDDTIRLSGLARAGALVGYSSLSAIDLQATDKWGTRNLLETVCYIDDVYAVLPMAWPELAYKNFGFLLAYNSGLVESMGETNPREYVEQKIWNWEKFREVLINYTVVEGDKKQYALFATYDEWFADMYARSNGSKLCVYKDGKYVNTFYEEAGRKALQETITILREYTDYISFDHEVNLTTGDCVMGVIYGTTFFDDVAMNVDNYGILPYPVGPDVDPDYTFAICESLYCAISIPVSAKEPELSAVVINALYDYLPGFESFDVIKDYYTTNFFYDERDADTYFNMYFNIQPNYYGNGGRVLTEGTTDSSATVASILERYETNMQTLIDDVIMPELQAAEIIWGPVIY